ncbi:hypothetical protein PCANC_27691 [Puccinia coronata f. sp. avenae]|uniref:Mitochondrial carrier protein n=1 Tax=Puccinia coronata f. sp. avenae TaxID=200324 RepID=A0A2N5TK15_9BASI|nr:hypothetical protein PCANC_27691 [Puccinia coronata f. sp. avenae]
MAKEEQHAKEKGKQPQKIEEHQQPAEQRNPADTVRARDKILAAFILTRRIILSKLTDAPRSAFVFVSDTAGCRQDSPADFFVGSNGSSSNHPQQISASSSSSFLPADRSLVSRNRASSVYLLDRSVSSHIDYYYYYYCCCCCSHGRVCFPVFEDNLVRIIQQHSVQRTTRSVSRSMAPPPPHAHTQPPRSTISCTTIRSPKSMLAVPLPAPRASGHPSPDRDLYARIRQSPLGLFRLVPATSRDAPASASSPAVQLIPLVSGVLSRSFVVVLFSPLELIRTRLQSTPRVRPQTVRLAPFDPNGLGAEGGGGGARRTILKSVVGAVRLTGLRSLYAGLPATLWRDVPFSGLYWSSYEAIRRLVSGGLGFGEADRRASVHQLALQSFLAGSLSGAVAATLTNPFDVVKTRRQASPLLLSSPDPSSPTHRSPRAPGTIRIILQIARSKASEKDS